jgi:hypothetical protein
VANARCGGPIRPRIARVCRKRQGEVSNYGGTVLACTVSIRTSRLSTGVSDRSRGGYVRFDALSYFRFLSVLSLLPLLSSK